MGFFFRRSASFGPFRLNFSKSGVGWSVGGGGFRTGKSATGRKYSTFGIPGTGMGYRSSRGCMPLLAVASIIGGSSLVGCMLWEEWNYV